MQAESMSGKLVIGVDIGGTKVAAGLVSAQGEILQQARGPMVSTGDAATGLAAVTTAVRDILRNAGDPQVSALAVCCAGPLDSKTGVVLNPPDLNCCRDLRLAADIAKTF